MVSKRKQSPGLSYLLQILLKKASAISSICFSLTRLHLSQYFWDEIEPQSMARIDSMSVFRYHFPIALLLLGSMRRFIQARKKHSPIEGPDSFALRGMIESTIPMVSISFSSSLRINKEPNSFELNLRGLFSPSRASSRARMVSGVPRYFCHLVRTFFPSRTVSRRYQ